MGDCPRKAHRLRYGHTTWTTGRRGERDLAEFVVGMGGKPGVVPHAGADRWTIESSDLGFWSSSNGSATVWGLTDHTHAGAVFPYVGWGLLMHWGFERIGVQASRTTSPSPGTTLAQSVDRSLWALRMGLGLRAIAGTEFKLSSSLVAALEGDWTLCTDASKWDLGSKRGIYDVVHRSNGNLTGWTLGAGLRWFEHQ